MFKNKRVIKAEQVHAEQVHAQRVEASQVVLRDAAGNLRCIISVDPETGLPTAVFFDAADRLRIALGLVQPGATEVPFIAFYDAAGMHRIGLSVCRGESVGIAANGGEPEREGGIFAIYDEQQQPGLTLSLDSSGEPLFGDRDSLRDSLAQAATKTVTEALTKNQQEQTNGNPY